MAENVGVQVCGLCKEWRKVVKVVQVGNTTVKVGRCLTCDTIPCPNAKCEGRTMSPTAKQCHYCKRDISLEARK